jgi:CRP-like cAMP-binding protein
LKAGELPRAVYLVLSGGVKELRASKEGEGGREVIVALHAPGELFGELAMINEEPLSTSFVALTQTQLVELSRDRWLELLHNPAVLRMLNRRQAKRLADAQRFIVMLARYTTEARLKSALLLLAERWGKRGAEGTTIGIELTHRTLADLAGASREKVTRALGILSHKGLVKVVHKRLVIPSLERLLVDEPTGLPRARESEPEAEADLDRLGSEPASP